jgi:hypothetical protein
MIGMVQQFWLIIHPETVSQSNERLIADKDKHNIGFYIRDNSAKCKNKIRNITCVALMVRYSLVETTAGKRISITVQFFVLSNSMVHCQSSFKVMKWEVGFLNTATPIPRDCLEQPLEKG